MPVEPTLTLPKLSDVGAILNVPAVALVVPVPIKGTVREGPTVSMYPELVPADFGAKESLTVTVCPMPKMKGIVGPLTENPVPANCSESIFVLQGLRLVSVTDCVVVAPTAVWPKERLAGLARKLSLVPPPPENPNPSAALDALLVNIVCP